MKLFWLGKSQFHSQKRKKERENRDKAENLFVMFMIFVASINKSCFGATNKWWMIYKQELRYKSRKNEYRAITFYYLFILSMDDWF